MAKFEQNQPPQAPPAGAPQGAPPPQQARAPRVPPPKVPPEFEALPIWTLDPPKLLAMVKDPKSTVFQKAIAMKKLAFTGGKEVVPVVTPLLSHPELACYARFCLEPNPDPSVDEALRANLPKLKGRLQIGVITTIGVRKDVKALDALTRLMDDSDAEVAGAAAASIGQIGGPQSAKVLQAALAKTQAPIFPVVARATLQCVETLVASNKPRAVEIYTQLSGTSMPEPVRRAALRWLNATGPAPAYTKKWPAPTGEAAEKDTSGFLGRRPQQ